MLVRLEMRYSPRAVRFGQEHIGALVKGRYSLVTQQRGRVLGPAYQAHDHEDSTEVFLKLFVRWPEEDVLEESLERWLRWGQFGLEEDHPWGPTPVRIGRDPRGTYLVSPWVYGSSIADGWAVDAEPTILDVVGALCNTLDTLKTLHDRGLIHGAVRPSQVLMTEQGSVLLLRPGLDLFVASTLRTDPDRWALIKAARSQAWAPEVLARIHDDRAPFPEAPADVFGFGRVIEAALDLLPRDLGTARERLRWVAQQCLKPRPNDRPSLDEILRQVETSTQRHRRPRASAPPLLGAGTRDWSRMRGPGAPGRSPSLPIPPAAAARRRRRPTDIRSDQPEVPGGSAGGWTRPEGPHEDALGRGPHEDALGRGPHEDALGRGPHEDALGRGPHEDALGRGPHEDALGRGPHEDALGRSDGRGADTVPHPAIRAEDRGPPAFDRDALLPRPAPRPAEDPIDAEQPAMPQPSSDEPIFDIDLPVFDEGVDFEVDPGAGSDDETTALPVDLPPIARPSEDGSPTENPGSGNRGPTRALPVPGRAPAASPERQASKDDLTPEVRRDWTEAETFARYGLHNQAVDRARAVLKREPTFAPARDLLDRLAPEASEPDDEDFMGDDQTILAPINIPPSSSSAPSLPTSGPSPVSARDVSPIRTSDGAAPLDPPSFESPRRRPGSHVPPMPPELEGPEPEGPPDPDAVFDDGPALDENVQFTVYRPRQLIAQQWADLLFFAHLSERRPDAPVDQPDPVAEVQRLAAGVLGDAVDQFNQGTSDARAPIPREGTLTIIPAVESVTFNPPRASFVWSEEVHLSRFRVRSDAGDQTARGTISVYYGAVLVGDVPITLRIEPSGTAAVASSPVVPENGRRYRKIFASYSRRDLSVVKSFEAFARGMGDRYLLDLLDLRSGEVWSERLEEMIRSADVFQLFWSKNAMGSRHVLAEVQYALSLPQDIRPVFWERPLPQDPGRNLPPPALGKFHFQFLAATDGGGETSEELRSAHLRSPRDPSLIQPRVAAPSPAAARATSTAVVACSACGQHNLRSNKECVRCGHPLENSISVPPDLYDPFDSEQTRGVQELPDPTNPVTWDDTGTNIPVVQPSPHQSYPGSVSMRTPAGSVIDGPVPAAGPSRGSSVLMMVLIAFGLALLIVSAMTAVFLLVFGT